MEDVMTVTTTEPAKSLANDGAPPATVIKPTTTANQQKSKLASSGRKWLLLIAAIVLGTAAYFGWQHFQPAELPEGFVSSNGRIEATEIDISAKIAGRLVEEFANEGDLVTAHQVLARIDTDALDAQLREAQADLHRAKNAVETAHSGVSQRESEKAATEAVVLQREAELDLAQQNYSRSEKLVAKAAISKEDFDTHRAQLYSAKAAVSRAKADVAAATAAIITAKSQVIESQSAVSAAEAKIERLQADINDCTLKAPRDGRVQFRVAQPGEVLPSGGKVLNMVDLADVYMTFFLPTEWAGRVPMGAEVRIVLDSAPQFVIPAKVTFVADVAQFTPKTVETAEERQKLTFRIKAHIPPDLLKKYVRDVKTGLPGVAYVQLDPAADWPAHLEVKLPQRTAP
jgi:HlyD family secretion protein